MTSKKLIVAIFIVLTGNYLAAGTPHFNLFNPYDCLVTPTRVSLDNMQITGAYEYAYHGCGYQAEEDERSNSNCFRKCANILQLYQNEQDVLAALKGDKWATARSRLAQKFNINDDDGSFGLFVPYGSMRVNNLMFSARYGFRENFSLSAHLPLISMSLHNVSWLKSPQNNAESFESNMAGDLIADLERVGNICLSGWSRTGIGDLATLIWWEHYFPQARPILAGTMLNTRIGFTFPTGKKSEDNYLFCPPFGNGGGLGLLGGFHLDLYFIHRIRAGLDVELYYPWGHSQLMRIKTDTRQTDLLLLNQACVFKKPGFMQHFTLSLGAQNFYDRLSIDCSYQFTKQQDTELYTTNAEFNHITINTTESLLEWTTHSFIATLALDLRNYEQPHAWEPYLEIKFKHGFNGQRAVLMNSITGLIAVEF